MLGPREAVGGGWLGSKGRGPSPEPAGGTGDPGCWLGPEKCSPGLHRIPVLSGTLKATLATVVTAGIGEPSGPHSSPCPCWLPGPAQPSPAARPSPARLPEAGGCGPLPPPLGASSSLSQVGHLALCESQPSHPLSALTARPEPLGAWAQQENGSVAQT